jgi:hypothetical protein
MALNFHDGVDPAAHAEIADDGLRRGASSARTRSSRI